MHGAFDGGGGEGGMSPVNFKECQCCMSLSRIYAACHMLNLQNGPVTCHCLFDSNVACQSAQCCL